MANRFTPVLDPEKARCEQNEEDLRKHRQFDTPFALLPKNLNEPKQPKGDLHPLAKQSEDLYLDENKLWRKKTELFDRQKTWGRETFECANPEETRNEANSTNRRRPGEVGWGVRGHHGSSAEDNGALVLQRGEVDQAMVKNEKGLWVQKKAVEKLNATEAARDRSPLPEGGWRCPRCNAGNSRKTHFCEDCGIDRAMFEQYRSRPGEDPRLEAAKPRGRGTTDAQAKALQALEARRRGEKEHSGMTRRPGAVQRTRQSEAYVPLNSKPQQIRSSKRLRKYDQWQGVHRTDEDAVRIVGKAMGGANIGKDAVETAKPVHIEDVRESTKTRGRQERSPSACSCRVSSPSDSQHGSPVASRPFAWQSPSRSRSPARHAPSPSPRSRRLGRVPPQPEGTKKQTAVTEEVCVDYF